MNISLEGLLKDDSADEDLPIREPQAPRISSQDMDYLGAIIEKVGVVAYEW